MPIPNPAIKFTYDDYRNTPDDSRYELLDGELVMAPAPSLRHQRTGIRLSSLLHAFVTGRRLGEVFSPPCDVILSDADVVQPDLLFVSRERRRTLLEGDAVRGAPDLVVEILSPSTAARDRTLKRVLYARHGVREYWLVDPDAETITVMVLGTDGFEVEAVYGKGETLTSPTLRGLAVNLDEVFE
jgi:Uma2 family endonuclease